jgi:lipopolysaccharide/colanic/teichoic acid biosynthesis glycosyltransferase
VGAPTAPAAPSSRILKRLLDLLGAVAGLVLLSPLVALVAVAIKLDSRCSSARPASAKDRFRPVVDEAALLGDQRPRPDERHLP